jgi:hypothetical protein
MPEMTCCPWCGWPHVPRADGLAFCSRACLDAAGRRMVEDGLAAGVYAQTDGTLLLAAVLAVLPRAVMPMIPVGLWRLIAAHFAAAREPTRFDA